MKKTIAIVLLLITMMLCLSSCEQKAIEIIPHLPDTYAIVVVSYNSNDIDESVYGLDSKGNKYYCDSNGREHVYLSKDGGSYDEYLLNEETGKYELQGEAVGTGDASLRTCYRLPHDNAVTGTYEKIDSLNIPSDINKNDFIFLDAERFEYYKVTSSGGLVYETAVEKETGICFYTCYDNGECSYISKYTVPFEGNYADLLGTAAQ